MKIRQQENKLKINKENYKVNKWKKITNKRKVLYVKNIQKLKFRMV